MNGLSRTARRHDVHIPRRRRRLWRDWGGHGRRDPCGSGALRERGTGAAQSRRRPGWRDLRRRRGDDGAGMEGGLPEMGGGGLERPRRAGSVGRPGVAGAAPDGRARDLERCQRRLRHRTDADGRRHRRARRPWRSGALGALPAEAGQWRMDGDHEPDRAAGRLRPRPDRDAGRARRRRQLPHLRPEDVHHLRRARPHRQHRPSGAGAHFRRAGRQPRHLAVRGAEGAGGRDAQRPRRRGHRGEARPARLADLHDGVWRGRRGRHRLSGRRRRTAASTPCSQ